VVNIFGTDKGIQNRTSTLLTSIPLAFSEEVWWNLV